MWWSGYVHMPPPPHLCNLIWWASRAPSFRTSPYPHPLHYIEGLGEKDTYLVYIPFRLIRTIYSGRQDGGGMGQPSGFCCTFMICHSLHIARTYSPLIQSLSTAARTSLIVSNPLLISERIRFPEFIRI